MARLFRRLGLQTALFVNTHFNAARRALGLPYWSFSAWAKLKVKNAVNFIGSFETRARGEAKRRGVDGVICGHIHHPTIRDIDGMTYVNTGDFVESCSLVVEHYDGRLEVLRWPRRALRPLRRSRTTAPSRTIAKRPRRKPRDAHPHRDRRLAAASQRRRLDAGADDTGGRRIRREFDFLTPQGMWTAPMPTYPDIRLAITSLGRVSRRIEEAAPDHIHIATEGPIGWLTRRDCLRRKRVFTTSYHTRFPEYI